MPRLNGPTARRLQLLAAAACVAAAATACATSRGQRYRYNVDFMSEGPPWKEARHSETKTVMTREYVRPGESLNDWHELLTVQVFDRARGGFPAPAPAEAMLRQRMTARCPGVVWNEIAADSASVLYEWRVAGCAGQPDQHEIARIFERSGARARVAYARKGAAMPDSVRAGWVRRLGAARFTTTPAR